MIDYLKLSVLIHLKDLVDKVEYFTFDPIFYNPLYLENSLKKIKRNIIGLNAEDIVFMIAKVRDIIKEEYGLSSNEIPKFILTLLVSDKFKKIEINKRVIKFNINANDFLRNKYLTLNSYQLKDKLIKISFEDKCKKFPLTPLITPNSILIRFFKGSFGRPEEVNEFIEKIKNIKERIIIPLACFIKSENDLLNFENIYEKIKDNLFDFNEINELEKYAIKTDKTILLINQLPKSTIPSRYEKMAFALANYQRVSIAKYSIGSSRPLRLLINAKYDAIITGDIIDFAIGYVISKLRRIPNFNDVRDPYLDFFTRSLMLNKLLLTIFINKAKKVFYAAAYLKHEYRIEKNKAVYLPNGAFLEWMSELNDRKDNYDLCYVGGLGFISNYLNNIFALIKNLQKELNYKISMLWIGVNKEQRIKLQKFIEDEGMYDSVKVIEAVPHTRLKHYISQCKIGLNLKAIGGGGKEFDYAVLGLPCIRLIKKGREGDDLPWVIKVSNFEEMKQAIKRLLQDENYYKDLSLKAIESIKNFYNLNKISKILVEEIFEK
jgi:glycosyltransferase involved in cell wall biosynthesis